MTIIIIGHSHTASLQGAARRQSGEDVRVFNLNRDGEPDPDWLSREFPAGSQPLVAMSYKGNLNNMLCLGEHPVPFSIGGATAGDPGRVSIPHSLFLDLLRSKLQQRLADFIQRYRQALPWARTVLLLPPPPAADPSDFESYPEVLEQIIVNGFAPADVRITAFRSQQDIYREVANEAGIACLEPPADAVDDAGLLRSCYVGPDPTHANPAYGELVLAQLRECLNAA